MLFTSSCKNQGILKLFLNIEDATTSENQRIIFKSLLMSSLYHKAKQRWSRRTNILSIVKKLIHNNSLMKLELCIIFQLFLNFSDSEPKFLEKRVLLAHPNEMLHLI